MNAPMITVSTGQEFYRIPVTDLDEAKRAGFYVPAEVQRTIVSDGTELFEVPLADVAEAQRDGVRDILHGEHAGCYAYEHGNHFLVDGRSKYVWYSQTGLEHLFNLENDPQEECDLALADGAEAELQPWRKQLVEILEDRPEGYVESGTLIAGRSHRPVMPGYDPEQTFPFS